MQRGYKAIQFASAALIGGGVLLLILNLIFDWSLNLALPLVFLMMGMAMYVLVFLFTPKWRWAVLLFVPGSILFALGIIFLLNVITSDWNSWAYAWLLLVAGTGVGLVLAAWYGQWRQEFRLIGIGLTVLGITLFAAFGAIAGGMVIRVMAPLLLALGGLAVRFLRPELFNRRPANDGSLHDSPDQSGLVEPLSGREIEVLRLIDQGLSNQEIASALTLAPSTVKTHINNIYGKLAVQTRVQAIKRARELGLLREERLN